MLLKIISKPSMSILKLLLYNVLIVSIYILTGTRYQTVENKQQAP